MSAEKLGVEYTCQNCKKRKESVRSRSYKTKNYRGMCPDSFCASSCHSDMCFPKTATICDACEKLLAA